MGVMKIPPHQRSSVLRRVTMQEGGDRVYRVPETKHWAHWHDPDAVVQFGTLVAHFRNGRWTDAYGGSLDRDEVATYARLKSVGVAKR